MTDKTLADELREWEERLGPEKVERAVKIVRSHGWGPGSTPPAYVWREAYAMVDGSIPEQWGNSSPSVSESILGFKLF